MDDLDMVEPTNDESKHLLGSKFSEYVDCAKDAY